MMKKWEVVSDALIKGKPESTLKNQEVIEKVQRKQCVSAVQEDAIKAV